MVLFLATQFAAYSEHYRVALSNAEKYDRMKSVE